MKLRLFILVLFPLVLLAQGLRDSAWVAGLLASSGDSAPGLLNNVVTDTGATPVTTNITLTGNNNAVRVFSGETAHQEADFNLYFRRNGGSVTTVKMYRWQGRILNAAAGEAISLGTDDGRTLQVCQMKVPAALPTATGTTGTANCDKAGPPLWSPANAHVTLTAYNSAFQIASNQQERIILISEYDGSTWSNPRWVWTQTNYNVSVQCTYKQIALANYDGATVSINAPTGSTIGGTSNYMMFALPAVTGTTIGVTNTDQFHAAIIAAVAGDEILIEPGLYMLTNRVLWTSFTANHNVNGNKGASGIIFRGRTGNRDDVWITGTNAVSECGWNLAQTGATNCTYFKDLTFAATNCVWFFSITGGQMKMGNVRITGPSLSASAQLIDIEGTNQADVVFCQFDNSSGDCFFNNGSTAVRVIGCTAFDTGASTADQCFTVHSPGILPAYGCTAYNSGQGTFRNGANGISYLYFCNSYPGGGRSQIAYSSTFASKLVFESADAISPIYNYTNIYMLFNHMDSYCTNAYAVEVGNLICPIAHNYITGVTNATSYLFNNAVAAMPVSNVVGNVSVGFNRVYNTAGVTNAPILYHNNTLVGLGFTGIRTAANGDIGRPHGMTNNATLGFTAGITVSELFSNQVYVVQGDYNVFNGDHAVYAKYGTNANEIFAEAAIDTTTFFPTAAGNCDGNGLNFYGWVGGSDPWGFVFLYKTDRASRGARDIPAIYSGAVVYPDFY